MNQKSVPKRIANAIIHSLQGGVVPRVGLEYIAVGRAKEIDALLQDVEMVRAGGGSFRFITGRYGSGKSFLMQTLKNYALEKGFVVLDADLSPERRLAGTKGQGLATYKELVRNLSTRTKPDGGALSLVLEKWISALMTETAVQIGLNPGSSGFYEEVGRRIYTVAEQMEGMVSGFDFARAILRYWEAYRDGDSEGKSKVLKWFRGEYPTKTQARSELGIHLIITDDNWYDFIKLLAEFLVKAGYQGMLVIVDELVNLYKIPYSIARQYNYEKLLMMYNDVMQGKAAHIGFLMGVTPQCLEDTRRGIYSYEALRSRLTQGRFSASLANDLMGPIIRLAPLTYEEMYVLLERLAGIHAGLYGYETRLGQEDLIAFLKTEYERIGADTQITPREVIRDFIELLNICCQNPDQSVSKLLGTMTLTGPLPDQSGETVSPEFSEFEI